MTPIAPNLLNSPEETEWVNPNAPPPAEDIADGLRLLNKDLPQEEIDDLHRQALENIEAAKPENHNYIMRLDTKSVIKTEKEYNWCLSNRVPLKVITYSGARQLLREEDARKKKEQKMKKVKKSAKRARRKNR